MKVLVVGGTGFVGRPLVRLLVADGHQVGVFHRDMSYAEVPEHVVQLRGDRDADDELRRAVVRFEPDIVVDVIPYTEPQARALVEALRGIVPRLVVLSSADVYRNYDGLRRRPTAPPDTMPLGEEAPLRESRYPYRGQRLQFAWADDYDKILVEQIVLHESRLAGTVLRLPAVYGPGDKQHRLRPYCSRMFANRQAVLVCTEQSAWRWTRGYVENVSAAVSLAVNDDRAADRVYNVGEARALAERQWVEQMATACDWHGEIVEVPNVQLPKHLGRPFDFRYELVLDTSRIREELAFDEPVSASQALRRTIEWERTLHDAEDPLDYAAEDQVLALRLNAR